MTRGGFRKGSGRKPGATKERRMLSTTIDPVAMQLLHAEKLKTGKTFHGILSDLVLHFLK